MRINQENPFDYRIFACIVGFLQFFSIFGFFICAFKDPGIAKIGEDMCQQQYNDPLFCDICRVMKPNERTLHCRICNVCIDELGIYIYKHIYI